MEIAYSDGSIEDRIISILRSNDDLAAITRIQGSDYGNWATRYHLCPERANLVRHLNFDSFDVLELGAGMGAVSRYLAENAKHLHMVEGTKRRYEAASQRLRDLSNWSGQVGNIESVELTKKFDVVCLIGVLEYSDCFVKAPEGETPYSWVLKRAQSSMTEDGVLVLAIENQLGLKYWSGAAEDHTGRLFDGICGYPLARSPRTFSRQTLAKMLKAVGFKEISFHFPFPDYKIPSAVLTEDFVDHWPMLSGDLATQRPFENYNHPRFQAFPDELAARSVSEAGFLKDVSNSFLVIASVNENSKTLEKLCSKERTGEMAWYYSLDRKLPSVTRFCKNKDGLDIKKRLLASTETAQVFTGTDLSVKWEQEESQPIAGEKLSTRLKRHAYFGEWDSYSKLLTSYLDWAQKKFKLNSNTLDGKSVDAVVVNAVLRGDSFQCFDLEFSSVQPVKLSWFILRNVSVIGRDTDILAAAPFRSLRSLYEDLCKQLQVTPDFESDLSLEAEFQSLVGSQNDTAEIRHGLFSLFSDNFGKQTMPRTPEQETALRSPSSLLRRPLARLNQSQSGLIGQIKGQLRKYPAVHNFIKQRVLGGHVNA